MDWKDKMRESLADCRLPEPEGLWEDVNASLVHAAGPKVRPLVRLAWAAAAAAAVAGVLIMVPRHAPEAPEAVLAESFDVVPKGEAGLVADAKPVLNTRAAKTAPAAAAEASVTVEEAASDVFEVVSVDAVPDCTEAPVHEAEPAGDAGTGTMDKDDEDVREYWNAVESEDRGLPSGGRRFSVSASFAGSEGMRESYGSYGGFAYSDADAYFANGMSEGAFPKISSVVLDNMSGNVGTDVHHRQPLRYALGFGWMLGEKIGLSTGLEWSRLVSDMKSGSSKSSYATCQKMDYLGVPLSLDWYLIDRGHFRAYASAGGAVQKCVSARSLTSYSYDEGRGGGDALRFSEKELQWSVSASLGVSYGISDWLGLFAEAGAGYWFDNGSDVDNIYKERPLSPSARFGLKFGL